MKKIVLVLSLLGLSSSAFATAKYKCFSVDDNEPYGLERLELTVKSENELAIKMDVLKIVTEKYVVDQDYEPKSPGTKDYLKLDVVNPHYDAYGEGPLSPFFVEAALFDGGHPLRRGGKGGFIKTAGHGYSWANYLCVLQ